jgi:hypothetical protein
MIMRGNGAILSIGECHDQLIPLLRKLRNISHIPISIPELQDHFCLKFGVIGSHVNTPLFVFRM